MVITKLSQLVKKHVYDAFTDEQREAYDKSVAELIAKWRAAHPEGMTLEFGIDTISLNKEQTRVAVVCVPNGRALNNNYTFQFSPAYIQNMCAKVAIPSWQLLNMINAGSLDGNKLRLTFKYTVKGETWTNNKTGENGVYEYTTLRSGNEAFILGGDVRKGILNTALSALTAPSIPSPMATVINEHPPVEAGDTPEPTPEEEL